MKISMIAAMANNRVIGKDNQMPWHLPADLKHFKQVTIGKPVIMGRKTYESIGKALPGRENIVISRKDDYQLNDACVVPNIEDALAVAEKTADEVMIIGGGAIYSEFLPKAEQLFLTFIDLEAEGDTRFPDWEMAGKWTELSREQHQADEKNAHNYEFVTLLRN